MEGANFLHDVKRKDVIGATSLYEINRLTDDHERGDEPHEPAEVERLLDERLPQSLQSYRDVFSKVKSETLPPHREGIDQDIQPERENTLAPSPRYGMLIEHLQL